jgi:hypothetical protein
MEPANQNQPGPEQRKGSGFGHRRLGLNSHRETHLGQNVLRGVSASIHAADSVNVLPG